MRPDAESRGRRIDVAAVCMLALTFSTGVADAAGYLALDQVFTGNMTGNVVILGMAIGQADDLPVAGPSLALVAFLAGAAIGGRVLRTAATGWTGRVTALLVVVAGIMAVCVVVDLAWPVRSTSPAGLMIAGMLACALGIQAATARRVAVVDVTTVVVTSTLTSWASESRLAGGRGQAWPRRFLAVAVLILGALVGALLLRLGLAACIALSVLVVVIAAVVGHIAHKRASRRLVSAA